MADLPERLLQDDESPAAKTHTIEHSPFGSKIRRPSRLTPWLFALLFAALSGLFLLGGRPADIPTPSDLSLASASSPVNPAAPLVDEAPRYVTQKIRDLQVGTWVLADNPELEDVADEYGPIDPAHWRKIALRMHKPDGGTLHIDFLRPATWLADQEARVGGSIHLQLEELGIDGLAQVLSVTSCPPLSDRPSEGHHLVTGTFAHSAGNVIDLHIEGLEEPIGTTANHPFWSADRDEFVQAGEIPFEPYAPVRRQLLNILRVVNRARKRAGYGPLPSEFLPLGRRVVRPFDHSSERRRWKAGGAEHHTTP